MNRTFVVGLVLAGVGFLTHMKFTHALNYDMGGATVGTFALILGLFLIWNGYVADYNSQPSFAVLG